jgi:murein DD-endopeptidase MepM/ murein hydrolase activator NlpD
LAEKEERFGEEKRRRCVPKLTGRQAPGKRLVLGFDGGCSACGELARRIGERLSGKLEILSLHDPQVEEWRKKTLGEEAPLIPTLFEVKEPEVRAWTGWRLGANLGRFLGPVDTWRIMQALDEVGEVPEARTEGSPADSTNGLTRGQFLKGVGGAAVAISVLSSTGKLISPAKAAPESATSGSLTRARDEAVGASIAHPAEWSVEREGYTLDDTYGFTVWKPESDSSRDSHDHGGKPAVRVALAYGLQPGQIEATVRARLDEYSHLSMTREEVRVGRRKLKGVAIGPIPGSTPSTEMYVPVEGRVYQINVYGEKLDTEGRSLLLSLEFGRPSRSVDSLGLPDANAPESLRAEGDQQLVERERSAKAAAIAQSAEAQEANLEALAQTEEVQLKEGCWKAASWFFFQTQHGMYANQRWGTSYTGWTQIGIPNYWGEYTHGSMGYGRCASKIYTNDKYAIDYPLGKGDVIFSPFKRGTVTFAGRNYTHKDYGILVCIKSDDGRYVSLSAHLSGLASGITRGARVTDATIIGYAGDTGGSDIPVGDPHLHQAYYRYPRYNPDGSPYGGAGLKVVYHHYVGTAAGTGPGVYKFGKRSDSTTWTKGDWISN